MVASTGLPNVSVMTGSAWRSINPTGILSVPLPPCETSTHSVGAGRPRRKLSSSADWRGSSEALRDKGYDGQVRVIR
jgi:hypothetical protein